jgi:hypothetical protein
LEVAATNTFGSSTLLVISSFHLVELGIIIIFIIIRHWDLLRHKTIALVIDGTAQA